MTLKIEDIDEMLVGMYSESYPVHTQPEGLFDPIPLEEYEAMMALDNLSSQQVEALKPREMFQTQCMQPLAETFDTSQEEQYTLNYQPPQHYQYNAAANSTNTNSYYDLYQTPKTQQTPFQPYYYPQSLELDPIDDVDSADSIDSGCCMDASPIDSDYDPIYPPSPSTVSSSVGTPSESPRTVKDRKKGETVFLPPPAFADEQVGMFGMINFRKPGAWTRQKSK